MNIRTAFVPTWNKLLMTVLLYFAIIVLTFILAFTAVAADGIFGNIVAVIAIVLNFGRTFIGNPIGIALFSAQISAAGGFLEPSIASAVSWFGLVGQLIYVYVLVCLFSYFIWSKR